MAKKTKKKTKAPEMTRPADMPMKNMPKGVPMSKTMRRGK
jgi:hypothetical protein